MRWWSSFVCGADRRRNKWAAGQVCRAYVRSGRRLLLSLLLGTERNARVAGVSTAKPALLLRIGEEPFSFLASSAFPVVERPLASSFSLSLDESQLISTKLKADEYESNERSTIIKA